LEKTVLVKTARHDGTSGMNRSFQEDKAAPAPFVILKKSVLVITASHDGTSGMNRSFQEDKAAPISNFRPLCHFGKNCSR
jgi:hypothetical protein